MINTTFIDARILLPDGILHGWLTVDGDRITGLGPGRPPASERLVDLAGRYLAPGLVDVHCHGAAGAVVYSGSRDDLELVTAMHLRHGTTSMLASVSTVEADLMITAATVIGAAVREGGPANLAGLHLEGPFLSPVRRGAQLESALLDPDPVLTGRLLEAAGRIPIMMTIAPELDGAVGLIGQYSDRCRFAIGHTDAAHGQVIAAIDAGARHVTHLFNGMAPLEHRNPGPIAAALTDRRVSYELIADGHHILPPVLALAAEVDQGRRTVLVTDASIAAGLGDGNYHFAGREVDVVDGVVRRAGTGSLAGSTAFLLDCVRTMITEVGVGLVDAFRMAGETPAAAAGLTDRGALRPGYRADLLVLSADLELLDVYCGGNRVARSPSGRSDTGHEPALHTNKECDE
jgi:N-acetylglucosamine-6-phosphate deacetylase